MHLQAMRNRRVDGVEEPPELLGPMPAMELSDDAAGFDVQRPRTTTWFHADGIVRAAFDLPGVIGSRAGFRSSA